MAKELRRGATYPDLHFGGQPLVVERLRHHDVNVHTAAAILDVMREAYAAQFEGEDKPLEPGAIETHLFPNTKRRKLQHHGRMSSHMTKFGSQYWLVGNPKDPGRLVGLAKITPNLSYGGVDNGYFNDIAVRPEAQHHNVGRALAHAALKFGSIPQDRPLTLDGYAGNPVNDWFTGEWGMTAQCIDYEGLAVGNVTIPQIRYVTESGLAVAGLVSRFEENLPALATGEFGVL